MPIKRIRDVLPKLEPSDLWEGRFDECLDDMALHSYELVSLEDNVAIRVEEGLYAVMAHKEPEEWKRIKALLMGNATRACFVMVPSGTDQLVYITKVPLLVENAHEATKLHVQGKEFALTQQQLDRAMNDCIPIPRDPHKMLTVFDNEGNPTNIDPADKYYEYQQNILYVKTKDFGNEFITRYLFGDYAMRYGEMVSYVGIKRMQIGLSSYPTYRDEKGEPKAYVRSVWFDGFDMSSAISPRCGIGGVRWDSNCNTRLRGRLDLAEHIDVLLATKEEERILKQMRMRGVDDM